MTDITLEQRARALLAAEYERDGLTYMVDGLLHPDAEFTPATTRALRAIEAALRLSAGAVADALDASRYRRLKALPIEIRWNSYLSIFPGLLDGHDHILDAEIDKEEAAPRHETGEVKS